MIEISFGKLVLLALVALIVLGPEKLPHAARTAGVFLRRVRTGWDSVRAEVERELQVEEIRRQAREVAAKADAAQADLDATLLKMRPQGGVTSSSPANPPAPPLADPPPDTVAATSETKEVPHGGA
jgi:sec-independent protein translocase protein TatB